MASVLIPRVALVVECYTLKREWLHIGSLGDIVALIPPITVAPQVPELQGLVACRHHLAGYVEMVVY